MTQQATAKLRYLRTSPRKVRLLVDLIRGLKAEDAVNQLMFSQKDAARPILKLLQSAIANARTNHGLKEETLVIKTAFVDGGPIAYRYTPRAFGRATPIRKRTSHITLVLEGEEGGSRVSKKEKEDAKDTDDVKKEKKTTAKRGGPKKTGTAKNVARKVTLQRRSGG